MTVQEMSADEEAIRKLDAEWSDAASGGVGNLDRVVAFYAPNGSTVWPGAPAAHGTKNIRKAWKNAFESFKDLKLKFGPTRIEVSQSGDMASDFGKVAMEYTKPRKGRVKEQAKYVVVWIKVDGAWKVLYDCYNSNSEA